MCPGQELKLQPFGAWDNAPTKTPSQSVIKVLNFAYKHNLASYYLEPKDREAFVRSLVYTLDYDSFTLDSYTWPKEAISVQMV